MKLLSNVLIGICIGLSGSALGSLPYPEFDMMPKPYQDLPQPHEAGWSPTVLPDGPRYEHESLASECFIPPGMYRYEMIPGQDFRTDMAIKKAMVKFHVNKGGMAIVTLELQPNKSSVSLQRLLGDEPRRELYVINSYTKISDLNRCSGGRIRINADQVELYDKTLNGVLTGYYEPERQCLRVDGELVRRRPASGFLSESKMRIRLDNVCLQYRSR